MRLLIIGLLEGYLSSAAKIAIQKGADVSHASSITSGLNALRKGNGADLLLVEAGLNIGELATALKAERFHIPLVACGANYTADDAVKAIKAGAKEFMPLPPDAELIAAIFAAVSDNDSKLIWRSRAMNKIIVMARQIAGSGASVLISGESGVGKEVVARLIHSHSGRSAKPFIAINCAAIPEQLLESELFGHEKGSFTGAIARRIGKFEEASGGTLLLDEVTEMNVRLQAKLLRVLQEKELDRLGGKKPIAIDIRVIATSNRDLEQAVEQKIFRQDLFYRLNVINLQVPPLRDRPEDIEILSNYFADKYSKVNGISQRRLSAQAITILASAPWPGNVRELENTIHRAVLLASSETITAKEIISPTGDPILATPAIVDPAIHGSDWELAAHHQTPQHLADHALVGTTVAQMERNLIVETLDHCLGNRTHAAKILGISIRTLRNKLKKYLNADGITPSSLSKTDVANCG